MSTYKNPPKLRADMLYEDWKKDISIWKRATELDKKKQGAVLFGSLEGKCKDTVRAEVAEAAYDKDDIVDVIITCLDKLLLKDKSETAFQAFDNFIAYRRPKDMPIDKFLQEFNLRYTKIKNKGMVLPDGVLAYAVLKCCNLSEEQSQICRATVTDLKYDDMKKQILKVASQCIAQSDTPAQEPVSSLAQASASSVPVHYSQNYEYYDEEEYYEESELYDNTYEEEYPNDSFDDGPKDALYSQGSRRGYPVSRGFRGRSYPRGQYQGPNRNGYDQMGNARTCRYCNSTCHMLLDCPDAPPHWKENKSGYRGQYRGSRNDRGGRARGSRGHNKF